MPPTLLNSPLPDVEERVALLVPSRKKDLLKDLARGISLANLCFIGIWVRIVTLSSPKLDYYRKSPPDFSLLLPLCADVLLLGALVFGLLRFLRSPSPAKRRAAFILFFAVSALALNDLRMLILADISEVYLRFLWIAVFPALAAFSIGAPRRVLGAWRVVLLLSAPLFPILAINAAWLCYQARVQFAGDIPRAQKLVPARPERAIWIIFDELDERLAFDARPQRARLPEFDRLRRESLFATAALPPAPETLRSLPALITGRKIADASTTPTDLRLRFAGLQNWASWASQQNVFRRARETGFNTALSGWYHPYCRVIGSDLSDCAWDRFRGLKDIPAEPFLKEQMFFTEAALSGAEQDNVIILESKDHIEEEQAIYDNAIRILRDRDLNLVLIHFPIPHPSGIWDAKRRAFTTGDSGYVDNLMLADRVLGEVRRTLERSGGWQRSLVLVSSDHPYRPDLWKSIGIWNSEIARLTGAQRSPYVPFLLKLPGQREGAVYARKFNTVLSGDLLLDLLNHRLQSSKDVFTWLDRRAAQSLLEPEGPLQPLP